MHGHSLGTDLHLTEEERAAVPAQFKCSLYDDFEITLEDIFNGMLS